MNSNTAEPLLTGFYRHYKGRYYQLLAVVRHSEEEAPYALYRALYGDFDLWVRPLAMFCEQVHINGEPIARFSFVSATPPVELTLPPPLPETALWPGLMKQR